MHVRLDSFMGLLSGSINMSSLIFNFCSVQFYDVTILLDVLEAHYSSFSLNDSLPFLQMSHKD